MSAVARRKLISSDEAVPAIGQHASPCSDCPMRRDSLNGWLGGSTPDEYVALAHSDALVGCHTLSGAHCAGMAIYRANVCKSAAFRLPVDRVQVFAWPTEFVGHHRSLPARRS
ncbi:hypothetical protein [Nevskia ramosa]|uniref:hypothetical protein n=1 Tax=Nevskia ramosa TaxID=64002 RepID=UPI003D100976